MKIITITKFLVLSLILQFASCSLFKSESNIKIGGTTEPQFYKNLNKEYPYTDDNFRRVGPMRSIAMTDQIGTYEVARGDTLMQIAYKIYGDFNMWRPIANLNALSQLELVIGSIIKYNIPVNKFDPVLSGTPYLISEGDTLGIISNKVYSTKERWKEIWKYNQHLIHDKNKIYTGFTIYYQPDNLAQN